MPTNDGNMNATNAATADQPWSRAKSAAGLCVAYYFTFMIVMLFCALSSEPLLAMVPLFGLIVASPVLLVSMLILLVFHAFIRKHLALWCLSAPFIVVLIWETLHYVALGRFDKNFIAFLLDSVRSGAIVVLGFATMASVLFFILEGGAGAVASRLREQIPSRHSNDA